MGVKESDIDALESVLNQLSSVRVETGERGMHVHFETVLSRRVTAAIKKYGFDIIDVWPEGDASATDTDEMSLYIQDASEERLEQHHYDYLPEPEPSTPFEDAAGDYSDYTSLENGGRYSYDIGHDVTELVEAIQESNDFYIYSVQVEVAYEGEVLMVRFTKNDVRGE